MNENDRMPFRAKRGISVRREWRQRFFLLLVVEMTCFIRRGLFFEGDIVSDSPSPSMKKDTNKHGLARIFFGVHPCLSVSCFDF